MNMTQAWIFGLQSTLVLLPVLFLLHSRHVSPWAKVTLGRATLVVLVLLAAFGLNSDRPEIGQLPRAIAVGAPELPDIAPSALADQQNSNQFEAPVAPGDEWNPLPVIYTVGVGLLGTWFALGLIGSMFAGWRGQRVRVGRAHDLLVRVARQAGVRPPRLHLHQAPIEPFVIGILWPSVHLSEAWVDQASDADLSAVLVHEVAHVAHRDLPWQAIHRALSVVLWPQFLLLAMERPLRAASERCSDGAVLASGVSSTAYSELLVGLKVNGRARALGYGATFGMVGSSLGRRVEAILREPATLAPRRALARWGLVVLAAGIGSTFLFAQEQKHVPWAKPDFPSEVPIVIVDANDSPVQPKLLAASVRFREGQYQHIRLRSEAGKATLRVPANGKIERITVYGFNERDEIALKDVSPDVPTRLDFGPTSTLTGRVLRPSGEAAPDVRIEITLFVSGEMFEELGAVLTTQGTWATLVTTTDADGRYSFPGLPRGGMSVRAEVADLLVAAPLPEMVLLDQPAVEAPPLRVAPAASIRGVLLDRGRPVVNAQVGLQPHEGGLLEPWTTSHAMTRTNANGEFTLRGLVQGRYNVMVQLPRPGFAGRVVRAAEGIRIGTGEHLNRSFATEPASVIEGKVFVAGQVPTPSLPIGIYGPAHPQSSAWVQMVETDKAGRFRAEVPAGSQYVYIMDGLGEAGVNVTTTTDKATKVELKR